MTRVTTGDLVDHAWIDDGAGVLSCVAGSYHSSTAAVVCPYYIRTDILASLAPLSTLTQGAMPGPAVVGSLAHYIKIAQLCKPEQWAALLAMLSARHGLHPMAWSLFTNLDITESMSVLDPRTALRIALRSHTGRIAVLLADLCSGLGDPDNDVGMLGLTGSAALDPTRLDVMSAGTSGDIDVIVYPAANFNKLQAAIKHAGGQFPVDLTDRDPRRTSYHRSRLMPSTTDEWSRGVFWRRRRDLAWIGPLRLDLTFSKPNATAVHRIAYAQPPIGPWSATVTVTSVHDHQYPVMLGVEHPDVAQVWITARGYQTVLLPGDILALRGLLHCPSDRPRFVSIDDAAEHQIILLSPGDS